MHTFPRVFRIHITLTTPQKHATNGLRPIVAFEVTYLLIERAGERFACHNSIKGAASQPWLEENALCPMTY